MSKEYWVVMSQGGLRMRQTPTLQGKALGVLPCQTIVVSTVRQENWIQHSQGWSMFENGDKQFAKRLTAADYPTYEVISKGGLRSRESPAANAKETVVLATGSVIFCLETQGFWVRHPEGWSMMHSDPAKGEKKIFLQERGNPKNERVEARERAFSNSVSPVLSSAAAPVPVARPEPLNLRAAEPVVMRAEPVGREPVGRERGVSVGRDGRDGRERALSATAASPTFSPASPRAADRARPMTFEEEAKGRPSYTRPTSGPIAERKDKQEASEADLDAYKETLRAMCLDDRLSADELRFLAEMRRQRMIKEKQHFQALVELGITKERFTAMIKNDRDENRHFVGRECVSCMDAVADWIVLRCFHMCLCERCASDLKNQPPAKQKCPKCNAQFTEIQKVF